MRKITSSEQFITKAEPFFNEVANLLFDRDGVQLSYVLSPQSIACYQVKGAGNNLQLRLVLIPLTNGNLLGRLSWLDWCGVDHVCCYVNEMFDVLALTSDGMWKKQNKSAEVLCLQEFEALQK
ncbi:hypothetical protein C0J08_04795 [Marinomonas sp. CT5]|uniref:hypothetical protein n=1 Tax=Marinomonas sp. CT5 TaxID=2066133 RepID=UPI001BAF1D62|nr:hypothetical protein [Marinomonas sp. CT5]QUX94767.1 hypothetical protein C0J08_04795 [Marinomonas sp. CT5]